MSPLASAAVAIITFYFGPRLVVATARHFISFVVWGLIVAVITLVLRRIDLNSYLEPTTTLHDNVQNRFAEMVKLCLSSYDSDRRVSPGESISGWVYVGNQADLSLHLWRKREVEKKGSPYRWALVVRGTKLIQELGIDCDLLRDSTTGSTTFNDEAERVITISRNLLRLHKADRSHHVTFTGHSLGATYAEILLHSLRQDYPDSDGVTFESPGQPKRYRIHTNMPLPLPSLITLNSTPNPINTLNRPAAADHSFYACGTGAGFPLAWLVRPTLWITLRAADIVLSLLQVVQLNVRTHSLRHLETHIYAHNYQLSDPVTWPLYTGNAFGSLHRSYCRLRGVLPYDLPPRLANHRPQQQQVSATPHPGLLTMLSIPTRADGTMDLAAMGLKTPYRIGTEDDLVRFRDGLGRWDVIYAIVGMNGMGKSSMLKALLGLDISDTSIPIGMGTNTTPFPVVAWICTVLIKDIPTRIYLMDTPGIGAAGASHQNPNTPFFFNNPAGLIDLIKPCVGSVFYVERDSAPSDHSVVLYAALTQAAVAQNIKIRVIYNTIGTSTFDQESGQASLIRRFTDGVASPDGQTRIIPSFDPRTVVRCRALTGDTIRGQGLDVTALCEMWAEEIQPENITRAGKHVFVEHRRSTEELKTRSIPILRRIAGGVVGSTIGLGGVGGLTWLPGAVWWWGPILCTIPGANICALPVVITGSAAGFLGYMGVGEAGRRYREAHRTG